MKIEKIEVNTFKSTPKKEKAPNERNEEKLLRNANVNSRGKGAKKTVVNKTQKKRR